MILYLLDWLLLWLICMFQSSCSYFYVYVEQDSFNWFCKIGSRYPVTSCRKEAIVYIWDYGLLGTNQNARVQWISVSAPPLLDYFDLRPSYLSLCLTPQDVFEVFFSIPCAISIDFPPSASLWRGQKKCYCYWWCLCASICKNTSNCKGRSVCICVMLLGRISHLSMLFIWFVVDFLPNNFLLTGINCHVFVHGKVKNSLHAKKTFS